MMYQKRAIRRRSCRMIAAITLILVMLATAAAVAVVKGNLLREEIQAAGGEFAQRVQDVHVGNGSGDFSFTIDEVLWEGDRMYLSYSVSVPDDGNTYLYALYKPRLGGKALSGSCAYFYDEAGMPLIHALGGELGSDRSDVIRDIILDEKPRAGANTLDMRAVFFKTDRAVRYAGDWEQFISMTEEYAVPGENENGFRTSTQLLSDPDALYYFGKEAGAECAAIFLEFHPDYWKNWWEKKKEKMDQEVMTPEELAATGIAELVDSVQLAVPLDLPSETHTEYNDVVQRSYEMDGFTLEITDFSMNHLNASFKAEIRADAEIPDEYAGNEAYGQFYALLRTDGSELSAGEGSIIGTGYAAIDEDGSRVYRVDQDICGIIPVEEIDALLLAPQVFASDGTFSHYDLHNAIRLQPVFNPDKPGSTPLPEDDYAEDDQLSS